MSEILNYCSSFNLIIGFSLVYSTFLSIHASKIDDINAIAQVTVPTKRASPRPPLL